MGRIASPAIVVIMLGLCGCSFSASPHLVCKRQVLEYVDDFGIHPGDINRAPFGDMSPRYPLSYYLRSCPTGHLVIEVSDQCAVVDSYTVNGCKVEGIPAR